MTSPFLDRRIDGLAQLAQYYEGVRGKLRTSRYELPNPNVQAIGDAAVLTFNYVSYGKRERIPLELHGGAPARGCGLEDRANALVVHERRRRAGSLAARREHTACS
jgi:hypothetical protein